MMKLTPVADFTTGPPFKTKLGSGEVVQGLDIGVRGMKVSGKRQLVIPWILGYGDEQVGLVPPKSTLTIVMVLDAIMKR
jgi:FKBP-type peptidyl-prolyl cis-trans isomerase